MEVERSCWTVSRCRLMLFAHNRTRLQSPSPAQGPKTASEKNSFGKLLLEAGDSSQLGSGCQRAAELQLVERCIMTSRRQQFLVSSAFDDLPARQDDDPVHSA